MLPLHLDCSCTHESLFWEEWVSCLALDEFCDLMLSDPGTAVNVALGLCDFFGIFLLTVLNIWFDSLWGFPGGSVVKNLPANAGDAGSIPGFGRSPGGGNGNPLQYSCLGNPTDRGAYSSWGRKELDKTDHAYTQWFSLIFLIGYLLRDLEGVENKGQNAKANIKSLYGRKFFFYGRNFKNRWYQYVVVAGMGTWEVWGKMAKMSKVR